MSIKSLQLTGPALRLSRVYVSPAGPAGQSVDCRYLQIRVSFQGCDQKTGVVRLGKGLFGYRRAVTASRPSSTPPTP